MRFRQYIEGLPFKIVTNHSSLRWLMRWSLKLQRFDFQMEHRKGSLNLVPDTLSRFDVDELELISSLPEIDLSSSEFNEPEYNELTNIIRSNYEALPDLRISENVVIKRVRFRTGNDDEELLWRYWLPKSLTSKIIRTGHEEGCHGSYNKTLFRIRQKCYCPKIPRDVKAFVSSCDDCKTIKPYNQISRPPMGDQVLTTRPFQRIYCDFLGPSPCSKAKNSQLFISLDHLTKFLFPKPMRAATSINVIDFFRDSLFCTFSTTVRPYRQCQTVHL